MTAILDHHLRDFADKHIIFDNQYHGHQNSSGRDNLFAAPKALTRRYYGTQGPFERYQGKGIVRPKPKGFVRIAIFIPGEALIGNSLIISMLDLKTPNITREPYPMQARSCSLSRWTTRPAEELKVRCGIAPHWPHFYKGRHL